MVRVPLVLTNKCGAYHSEISDLLNLLLPWVYRASITGADFQTFRIFHHCIDIAWVASINKK